MVDATNIGDILVLANSSAFTEEECIFSFDSNPIELGTDNSSTRHIYYNILFVCPIRAIGNIGVKWITGSALTAGIGTI